MAVVFAYPDNEVLAHSLIAKGHFKQGKIKVHHFPDQETLVTLETDVQSKDVFLVCSLDRPDQKAVALMFLAQTAKELGANRVYLIAPYLGYMRQDKRFHEGEAITSRIFAGFLSSYFDGLLTCDPHLHRYHDLSQLYSIPTRIVHAADAVGKWIQDHINKPVLIGPDEESDQWVKDVAAKINAPYTILEKIRLGDSNVKISIPELSKYEDFTPILIDDIISTARTMIETLSSFKNPGPQKPVCIGVHAVFASCAFENLTAQEACQVVTTNTINHETNAIDLTDDFITELRVLCQI